VSAEGQNAIQGENSWPSIKHHHRKLTGRDGAPFEMKMIDRWIEHNKRLLACGIGPM
jgi:hypothetical protein